MSNEPDFWRSVPVENDVYHVYSLCFARLRSRRAHENFATRDMHDGPMPLDYNLWILKNSTRTVLVDTGFGARASTTRGRPLDIDPMQALAQIGIDADIVDDVILTHLHYDHAGNIEHFPRARFHVQDAEVAFATGRCMCERPLRLAFDVEDVVVLVKNTYAERVRFHDGDASPLPGISLHKLPGHSAGMQAVRVMTSRGAIVLASDVSHYYANVLRRAPFIITVDAVATLRSYDRLLELAGDIEHVVPGHDPATRVLYPSREVHGIELTALHEQPKTHDIEALSQPGGVL
jgi:glyoxylase-like metal-dependent hydrolase (beta-lactamase superfamily II)